MSNFEKYSLLQRLGVAIPMMTIALGLVSTGCDRGASRTGGTDAKRVLSPEVERVVIAFCGDCHAMPLASSFPKDAWQAEVERGFAFYFTSGRTDLELPTQADVRTYFVSRAPDELRLQAPQSVSQTFEDRFVKKDISLPDVPTPAISFIDVVDPGPALGRCLIVSEMREGGIYLIPANGKMLGSPQRIATVRNPAAVVMHDWDRDGNQDFIVSDLGSFLPADHQKGRVVWLRQDPDKLGKFEMYELLTGLGRVSSTAIADFDGNGTDDILIAEFGWHDTGSISLATIDLSEANAEETASTIPENWTKLKLQKIDARPGTIHVRTVDLNEDGYLDFIALVSQEYEQINAYINLDGRGVFEVMKLHAAPDPSFGSSGIDLCDINEDGYQDILYTNGDSFDSFLLKPFHGVRWLENPGNVTDQPWPVHELGPLPGAHRAVAGFLFDNDLPTIVAGSFLPKDLIESGKNQHAESLVVWQQTGPGVFAKQVLSDSDWNHAAIQLTDVIGDQRPEIVAGHFRESGVDPGPALTVYQLID